MWHSLGNGPHASVDHLECEGLSLALLARLLRLSERGVAAARGRGLDSAQLGRVIDRMSDSLESGVSVAELADLVGVSAFHFSRLFKARVGEPPHAHLIRLRVERAKSLLRSNRTASPASVAAMCGFSDQAHLTRHFKRLVGTTPARFAAGG
jgi:AraC family transcriptional regulator